MSLSNTVVQPEFTIITGGSIQRSLRQYNRHIINSGEVKIVLIDRNIADVFTGLGWNNRSRYRLMNGRWAYVNGIRLNASVVSLLPSRGQ